VVNTGSEAPVVVVGAGIGGLASAIALDRAGLPVVVVEKAPGLSAIQVGGGLHMWTNAMRALERLGVAAKMQEVGAPLEQTEFRTWQGRVLARWPVGAIGRSLDAPDVGVLRRDLHRTLFETLPSGAVRFGTACSDFSQDEDRVTVRLSTGEEIEARCVVGADGVHSTVRACLFGSTPPRFAGYSQWQAVIEPSSPLLPDGVEQVIFGRGTRAILHPVGGNRLFWAAVVYGAEGTAEATAHPKEMLQARLAGYADPVLAALDATPETAITGFGIYDRKPTGTWTDRSVTLLGDAAHAMTTNLSQGACQALEDAVVLARCLSHVDSPPRGLAAYEEARRERTFKVVKRSWGISKLGKFANPVSCRLRDEIMSRALSGPGLRDHRAFVAAPL
jgi:2-polyprenyl-6-methoxyphenol hydroxylase-like FAD-dependent oxidoreductase